MGLPGCLFVCHLILLLMCFLFNENRLQPANATRWNSQLTMLRSILKAPKEKLDKLDTATLTSYATNQLQADKYVTSSLTIPVTRGLRYRIQQISAVYSNKMVTTFKESINKRLSRYEEDDLYMMATTVDPRFKLRWCNSKERHSVEQTFIDLATVQEELSPPNSDPASPPPAKARN